MIIDSHLHLGKDTAWDAENTEQDLMTALNENHVDAACVMPQNNEPTVEWAHGAHDRIAAFARANPGRIYGIANVHMYSHPNAYADEMTHCIKELGFVGIKMQAWNNGTNPFGKRTHFVFELAESLDVPVIIHTGYGMPSTNPSMWILPLRDHPKTRVIFAHNGQSILFGEVVVTASLCDNLYMDTSSTSGGGIRTLIKKFGAERVMFATDAEGMLPEELFKWRRLKISDAERDQCLWKTATTVFKLPIGKS